MKPGVIPLLVVLIVIAASGRAEAPPASVFLREAAYHDVQISPDGQCIGFIGPVGADGRHHAVIFLDPATGKMATAEAPLGSDDKAARSEALEFWWLTAQRALFSFEPSDGLGGGLAALDRNGKDWKVMWGWRLRRIYPNSTKVLVWEPGIGLGYTAEEETDPKAIAAAKHPAFDPERFKPGLPARNDDVPEFSGAVHDQNGDFRMGLSYDGTRTRIYFRENIDAPWRELPDLEFDGLGTLPIAIDWDRHTAYVDRLTRYGTWGLASYDLVAKRWGPVVAEDPVYDVDTPGDTSCRMVFSEKKQRLIGIRYQARIYRTLWLDSEMAGIQTVVDRALPGSVNLILNWSDDESRLIIGSYTDRHPMSYYFLDRKARRFRKLFDSAGWIKPEITGKTFPLSYKSRDGLLIHGFVTFPPDGAMKNLPMIVCMNPDFGAMGAAPEYDSFVQYLANRGYAVLRINPRGTPGYGRAFYDAGRKQQGLAVQNDVTDGVRWAIARGIADPRRIGVHGARLGGFSAEWALTHEPDLYRCGVANQAICNWKPILGFFDMGPSFIKRAGYADNEKWIRYSQSQMGDPKEDAAMIREMSPINYVDRIKAPVLVISYERDYPDELDQSKDFAGALESHGVPHELKILPKTRTPAETRQRREDCYNLIGSFFDKNLR